jgi:FAD/FMN-containing dehydrogenase
MSTQSIGTEALTDLKARFLGTLVGPTDISYEEVRRVHNDYIDRRPRLIACCRATGDVVAALAFARERDLEVAIRGGGHNVAGRSVVDGGIVIDLTPMKGIHVDPATRTARAQGGVTWGEFNRETQLFGLATTGGVISTTGIAGLTLGGGIGWLMGKHGLAADNLISAEVVLADGRIVTASERENADLFWAIRGGGGNFGVVTSFQYRLHPVTMVTAGIVAHPFERARDVLTFYREMTPQLPDEVVLFGGLVHAPDGSGTKLAALVACDCRLPGTDDSAMDAIRKFGAPVLDAVQPMPYGAANQLLDGAFPKGALNYWKSSLVKPPSGDAIDVMIEQFSRAPSPMDSLLLEHFHGAMTRVPVEATAYPHREEAYNFLVAAEWVDGSLTDRCVAWARETFAAMKPHMAAGRYVNYFGEDETTADVASAYGANMDRLREVKTIYDPDNVFHLNQNIRPADRHVSH